MTSIIREYWETWGPETMAVIIVLFIAWGIHLLVQAGYERDMRHEAALQTEISRRNDLLGTYVKLGKDSLMIINWDSDTYTLSDGKQYNKLLIERR